MAAADGHRSRFGILAARAAGYRAMPKTRMSVWQMHTVAPVVSPVAPPKRLWQYTLLRVANAIQGIGKK